MMSSFVERRSIEFGLQIADHEIISQQGKDIDIAMSIGSAPPAIFELAAGMLSQGLAKGQRERVDAAHRCGLEPRRLKREAKGRDMCCARHLKLEEQLGGGKDPGPAPFLAQRTEPHNRRVPSAFRVNRLEQPDSTVHVRRETALQECIDGVECDIDHRDICRPPCRDDARCDRLALREREEDRHRFHRDRDALCDPFGVLRRSRQRQDAFWAIEKGALCEVFQEERVTKRDAGSCPAEQGCLQGTREDAVLAGGDIARQVSRLLFVDAGSARLGELDRERNEEALDARRPRTRPFSRSLPQISATKWSATLAMRSGPERSRLPTLSRTRAISMNSGLPACSRER